jgi:hypothetical protein
MLTTEGLSTCTSIRTPVRGGRQEDRWYRVRVAGRIAYAHEASIKVPGFTSAADDGKYVQTHSFSTLAEARREIAGLPYLASAYQVANGWIAATVAGKFTDPEASRVLAEAGGFGPLATLPAPSGPRPLTSALPGSRRMPAGFSVGFKYLHVEGTAVGIGLDPTTNAAIAHDHAIEFERHLRIFHPASALGISGGASGDHRIRILLRT